MLGYILAAILFVPSLALSQATLIQDTVTMQLARVISVSSSTAGIIPGTETPAQSQTLTATILDGPGTGKVVTFTNDFVQLAPGDDFYLSHAWNELTETDYYAVIEPYRLPVLLFLTCTFLVLLVAFGGLQGVRGLASLIGSIVLIFTVLIPGILNGFSPVFVATGVAGIIIVLGSYITHGFNRTTSAAVFGMLATVAITGLLGYWAVDASQLSGFSEEASYLNFDTKGRINLVGLLFGGIMIGLLGVLYDIAIGQAVAVEELFHAGKDITPSEVLKRGLRIGREHIGALVNTLAIAYVGVSLPLLLLIQSSTYGSLYTLNSELFATEIIRILVGSIGLVLAVPITTYIASRMLSPQSPRTTEHVHVH